jgi:hypothetical protein
VSPIILHLDWAKTGGKNIQNIQTGPNPYKISGSRGKSNKAKSTDGKETINRIGGKSRMEDGLLAELKGCHPHSA